VQSIFQAVFASSDFGVAKPDTGFFHELDGRFRVERSRAFVLIDDDIRNVRAAESVGWRGFHFNPDLDPSSSVEQLSKGVLGLLGEIR
jgi:FMN phosphatase YigB (HAD superfamily)